MPWVVSTTWAAVACLAAAVLPQGAVSQNVAFNKTVWVSSVLDAYVKPRHEPPSACFQLRSSVYPNERVRTEGAGLGVLGCGCVRTEGAGLGCVVVRVG